MQVTETKNEGLTREFAITILAKDIATKVDAKLEQLKGDIRIPGFRPGKVPMSLLRKRYSKAVLGEVLESAVSESSQKTLEDNGLRPAVQPKIEVTSFDEGTDLEYKMSVELMPDFEPMDFSTLSLERLKGKVSDKEIDEAIERMSRDFRKSEPVARARKSKAGDIAVIDYVGKIDGEAFEGGSAEGHHLELGSGRFIPGFEDQLVGAKPGDHVTVEVSFPEAYPSAELAGKPAVFDVDVKELREYVDTPVDDEFAKSMGFENLGQLRDQIAGRLEQEYSQVGRTRIKRQLLDKLNDAHQFDVPPGMVDSEFEAIWQQFEQAKEQGNLDEDDAGRDEEELKQEYRSIAERRVRLGLLLSEVGRLNDIQVAQEELNRALIQEAQRHPGQEREVFEAYQNNPELMANLRAPVYEDKVIDFILEMAKVDDREVTIEELMKALESDDEEAAAQQKKPAKRTAKKTTAAKKAPAKT